MKVIVDADTCTGCEVCTDKVPEVFKLKNGIAIVINKNPDESYRELIEESMEECPSNSISIEE
ncbi:MAG: ferredoxin [Hydrogenobaculum sp.]|jgi:ferredoxin